MRPVFGSHVMGVDRQWAATTLRLAMAQFPASNQLPTAAILAHCGARVHEVMAEAAAAGAHARRSSATSTLVPTAKRISAAVGNPTRHEPTPPRAGRSSPSLLVNVCGDLRPNPVYAGRRSPLPEEPR